MQIRVNDREKQGIPPAFLSSPSFIHYLRAGSTPLDLIDHALNRAEQAYPLASTSQPQDGDTTQPIPGRFRGLLIDSPVCMLFNSTPLTFVRFVNKRPVHGVQSVGG